MGAPDPLISMVLYGGAQSIVWGAPINSTMQYGPPVNCMGAPTHFYGRPHSTVRGLPVISVGAPSQLYGGAQSFVWRRCANWFGLFAFEGPGEEEDLADRERRPDREEGAGSASCLQCTVQTLKY